MAIGKQHNPAYKTAEWFTPPWIIERLGPFDLDVCTSVDRPFEAARENYTIAENGLIREWIGRVWCNPPYGRETGKWLQRCVEHSDAMVLMFARTETRMFQRWVWPHATALLFIRGRLHFHKITGERMKTNSGGPSVLVAYGRYNAKRLLESKIPGFYVANTGVVNVEGELSKDRIKAATKSR